METPRFSVDLLLARRVLGSIHDKREGYLEGFNHRVGMDLEGDGCGGLGHPGIRIEIAEGLDVDRGRFRPAPRTRR
ncbi:MAG TPA: hypothetical protein VGP28_12300 [Methylocella sp.]|nr:hypothetical protein [Methylocella sp.]